MALTSLPSARPFKPVGAMLGVRGISLGVSYHIFPQSVSGKLISTTNYQKKNLNLSTQYYVEKRAFVRNEHRPGVCHVHGYRGVF
jgi:hypothetical protein